jgi:hypothetical protein
MCQGIPQLSKRHVLPDSGTNRNNDQRTLFFEMNHDPIGYNLGFDPQTNLQKVTALRCLALMSTALGLALLLQPGISLTRPAERGRLKMDELQSTMYNIANPLRPPWILTVGIP